LATAWDTAGAAARADALDVVSAAASAAMATTWDAVWDAARAAARDARTAAWEAALDDVSAAARGTLRDAQEKEFRRLLEKST